MYIITGVSFVHALVQKPNLWILQREPVSIFIESRLNRLVLHNKIVLYINFVFVTSQNQPTILDGSDKVCYLQATLCCIPKFFTMFLKPFIFQIVKVNVSSMIEIRPYDIFQESLPTYCSAVTPLSLATAVRLVVGTRGNPATPVRSSSSTLSRKAGMNFLTQSGHLCRQRPGTSFRSSLSRIPRYAC